MLGNRASAALAAALVILVVAGAGVAAVPEGPEHPSAEWTARESENFARTREEANRELTDPGFQARLAEQSARNVADYAEFQLAHGFLNEGNLCATWAFTCAGDPYRYPGEDPFYDAEGVVAEVLRFDRDCARISGRVWAPADARPGDDLPGVIITNGSVQAPEPLYWWFAQALVRNGYVAMTWDPRGQGRSDTVAPGGEPGSNVEPSVFWDGTVDAVDFFHSTPVQPYPHNATCASTVGPLHGLDAAAAHNPFWELVDRDRLGLAGHSLGATGVTRVQAMDPWEGRLTAENPVDVIVAWDSLPAADGTTIVPRVPAMGQSSEYGLVNVPNTEPPEVRGHLGGFDSWVEAGVPVSQFTIRGSTHYEWSLIPATPVVNFSATSWVDWGRPMAEHYSLAWFDRWLKEPGEGGYDTADERLLADDAFCERYSFYYRSSRNFVTRDGDSVDDADVRARCLSTTPTAPAVTAGPGEEPRPVGDTADTKADGTLPATGPAHHESVLALALVSALLAIGLWRRAGRPTRSG